GLVAVAISAGACAGCRSGGSMPSSTSPGSSTPDLTPTSHEQGFTSDDGGSFLAPESLARNTAPGPTGFALHRPPPRKPLLNLVLTTQPHDGTVAALIDAERGKVRIVKETPHGPDIVVEETWPIGGDGGKAMVLFAVRDGIALRLACIGTEST